MSNAAETRIYHLVTAYPQLTNDIKAMGPTAGEAFRKETHRSNLVRLSHRIERNVLLKHGGEIVNNGSGYGVKNSGNEFNDMISVKVTAAGLAALMKIPEIGRISEAIDLDNLSPVKYGTNVPPGVCWTRPDKR
ncbi:MAG: hypothetical protein ACAH80_10185 [Alphaproteobacteria bacterium]